MLLGYVILGSIWLEDEDLKPKYQEYEAWIRGDQNYFQVFKYQFIIRLLNGVMY